MEKKVNVKGMYTPDSEPVYGEDIINMITYMNKFSKLENFMNIGYADTLFEYLWFPPGISSRRLPERLAQPLTDSRFPPKDILVVGCGRGGEAVVLHELTGARIIGVDITTFNVRYARAYAEKKKHDEALTFLVGDACQLPVENESVSCVFSCESAFHYRDKPGFLEESYRVLKKGGYLLIADMVRRMPEESLLENEINILGEFCRMLASPGFFTLEDYKAHIGRAGFKEIIDCEIITGHNLKYLAFHSAQLVRLFSWLDNLPGFRDIIKQFYGKKQINIENFIKHSQTTAEAVRMKLVDYIVISCVK